MASARSRPRRPARRAARIVVVASRFHESVTRRLVAGAVEACRRRGIARGAVRTIWVPGAFELPVAAAQAAERLRPQAIVAVGCLIKGQTPQYAAIGHAVAQGLVQVSVLTKIPVGFGVILAESFAQARARAGGTFGNRGHEAAEAALEVAGHRARP